MSEISMLVVRRGVEGGWREPECRRHWGGEPDSLHEADI